MESRIITEPQSEVKQVVPARSSLIKLHLGAFNSPMEGWMNTDITPHIWITRVPFLPLLLHKMGRITADRLVEHRRGVFRQLRHLDVSHRFPLANESCQCVFSSHMLEHILKWQVPGMLREIQRVLLPGAVVRFAVPSLDLLVRLYNPKDPTTMLHGIYEFTGASTKNRHQWMYTEDSLCALLREHGFVNVMPHRFREGKCPDLEVIDNRPENSIYVEGEKPLATTA